MTLNLLFALGAASLLSAAPVRADITPPAAQVTAVSVLPSPGHAEIVIALQGAAEVRDFVLREPDRLVIDVVGATLKPGTAYDGIRRGGITDIRFSQFRPDVVRIAIYLDGEREYRLDKADGAVRVRFGADQSFLAWSSAAPADMQPPRAPLAQRPPEVTPPAEVIPASVATAPAPRITVTWDRANIGDVDGGLRRLLRSHHHPGQGHHGRSHRRDQESALDRGVRRSARHPGAAGYRTPRWHHPRRFPGRAGCAGFDRAAHHPHAPGELRLASQILPSIKSILSKRGTVVSDTTTNSLIVTETRSRIGEVQDFLKNLDIRTPQVSIQAKIIFVDRTNTEALGIQYDFGAVNSGDGPFFNRLLQRIDPATGDPFDATVTDLAGEGVAGIANAEAIIPQSALQLVWTTAVGGFRLRHFLSALQRVDLADVQAEPSITTVDNREAIDQGRRGRAGPYRGLRLAGRRRCQRAEGDGPVQGNRHQAERDAARDQQPSDPDADQGGAVQRPTALPAGRRLHRPEADRRTTSCW